MIDLIIEIDLILEIAIDLSQGIISIATIHHLVYVFIRINMVTELISVFNLAHLLITQTRKSCLLKLSSRLFIKDVDSRINFLIDSGSDYSVLPYDPLKYFYKKQPEQICSAANGSTINIYGSKLMNLNLGLRRTFPHPFVITSVTKPIELIFSINMV